MSAPQWIAWYPALFDAHTRYWPTLAVGAYIRLLHAQYAAGFIPSDVAVLAKEAGVSPGEFDSLWTKYLREKFEADDDNPQELRNPRLHAEREKAIGKCETNSKNGSLGGRPRKGEKPNAKAVAKPNAKAVAEATALSSLVSSQSSLSGREKKVATAREALTSACMSAGTADWVAAGLNEYADLQDDGRAASEVTLPQSVRGWGVLIRDAGVWGPEKLRGALDLFESEGLKRLRGAAGMWDSGQRTKAQQRLSGTAQSFANLDSLDRKLRERGVVE